jgi:hypothetical protein
LPYFIQNRGRIFQNLAGKLENRESQSSDYASNLFMKAPKGAIFDEKYRVVAVESQRLTIRGVRSGKVLTIVNPDPNTPLSPAEYPPGKLIALSDPSILPGN